MNDSMQHLQRLNDRPRTRCRLDPSRADFFEGDSKRPPEIDFAVGKIA